MTSALRDDKASAAARSEPDYLTGRGDPQQCFRIYRLCNCSFCGATGKASDGRCAECRGEGRTLDLVATAATSADVGVALMTLADEGEFDECPVGILEDGGGWKIKPWLPSARNLSDAGRVLRQAQQKGEK